MNTVATLRIKLDMSTDVSAKLAETRAAYVVALNLTSVVAFDQKIKGGVALHHATYRAVREATKLPANLVCSARAVVAEAYNRDATRKHRWKDHAALRYDARTARVELAKGFATLSTLAGRVRASLILCDYHRRYLDGTWTFVKGATVKRSGKAWMLHLTCHRDVPDSDNLGVLGVDAGIKRIATTSNAKVHKGGSISQIRRRKFRQRRGLQTKAGQSKTRGQRRLLKRLAGSENRAVEWKLWNVANDIVKDAIAKDCGTIAVEDLTHIRTRIKAAKKQRLIQQGWPFTSLQAKVAHVASRYGIKVVAVDARNTSRTCRCGHVDKANRATQSDFRCVQCGYSHNADIVAAHNIARRYVDGRCEAVNPRLMSAG